MAEKLQSVLSPIKKKKVTLVMLNKLRCHTHFQFSANQVT